MRVLHNDLRNFYYTKLIVRREKFYMLKPINKRKNPNIVPQISSE